MSKSNERLSDEYNATEAEHANAVEQKRVDEENKELAYYFHVAKKGQLAGWKPEERFANGDIKNREASLVFDEHIYIARDPKEVEFIEGHTSFGIHCFRCDSLEDAYRRAHDAEVAKNKRSVSVDLNIQADGVEITKAE